MVNENLVYCTVYPSIYEAQTYIPEKVSFSEGFKIKQVYYFHDSSIQTRKKF